MPPGGEFILSFNDDKSLDNCLFIYSGLYILAAIKIKAEAEKPLQLKNRVSNKTKIHLQ